jgi:uncharacterized protein involved in exopolysaccharide biosynthesis/Mrp family chromosome partitioning ATPase
MRGQLASMPRREAVDGAAPRERLSARAREDVETTLILRILWRRRRWIALSCLAAVALTLAYCLLATPQYSAAVQILIDPRDKQVVSNDVNPSSIAADGGVTQVESQGSVLLSTGVLERAIAATQLKNDPEFNGSSLLSRLASLIPFLGRSSDPQAAADTLTAETVATLRKHAAAKRADKVLVLDLTVQAKTPDKAAAIANAIAEAYLADQAEARAASSREASKALGSRLDELRASAKAADEAVEDYRAKNNFVISAGQLVSDQEINQTTAQLTAAQNRTASLRAELDQLRRDAGAQGTPEAMASGVMVRLRDRESAIVEKLSSASKQLGPLHPEIASLEQSLRDVRGLIAKETQRLRQSVEADYARAVEDERALTRKLDGMKSKSLDDDKADVHLRELQRQADAARSIYQAFLVRAKETMEAANVDTTNSRVISHALRPLKKSWPPTLLLLLGAAFGGLSLGASGSLAHEYLRPSLWSAAQLRDLVEAAALGPLAARDLSAPRAPALDAVIRRLMRALPPAPTGETAAISPVLHVVSAASAAAFRRALAERLAASAARAGRQTLLIEGDLAASASSDGVGFADVLRGEISVADAAHRREGEGFQRLARGSVDAHEAASAVNNDAFRMKRIRRGYDLVVLDAGAMSENDRLTALAEEADLRVLVAALGAPQSEIEAEARAAELAGAAIDAVVLIEPVGGA